MYLDHISTEKISSPNVYWFVAKIRHKSFGFYYLLVCRYLVLCLTLPNTAN